MNKDPYTDINSFITTQEKAYEDTIELPGRWNWSMKDHIETTYLYANSQLKNGKDDFTPVKNITRPILNLQHRTEDVDVKHVNLYVDDPERYHLSFLVKKYHDEVFVRDNDMDTFFDELNVSRIDYGAGLSKKLYKARPEVVDLHTIAFCDQTDILSGPIGISHFYAPDQLMDMASVGWGDPINGATASLQEAIVLAKDEKRDNQNDTTNKTPGRYVKVYEVHGNFPKHFLDKTDDSGEYSRQIHIVCPYQKEDGDKGHVILFQGTEKENPFKLIKRDPIYGRALGFGGAEELFDAQVWTTYDMIRIQSMLDAAAITILKTTDPNVAARNKVRDMDNMDIIELEAGTDLSQVDTFPRNISLFQRSVADWEAHAGTMGAAQESNMGVQPAAGTPFKLQALVTSQANGLHEYRMGQYAKHLEEIYNDWIIPHIEEQITKGSRFLAELSLEETQYVMDAMVTNLANQRVVEMVIAGEEVTPEIVDTFKELVRGEFKKKGNKHFVEILKGEFNGSLLKVRVSVKGKSKDLGARTDNLVNVFRQIIANPAVLRIPAIARIFNDIIESSGLDPADFTGITQEQIASAAPQQGVPGTEQPGLTQPGLANQPQQA